MSERAPAACRDPPRHDPIEAAAAIPPCGLWYNFVRAHKTLRISPAMAAGIETRLWSMEDVAKQCEPQAPAKRGS